jgi:hypothetical protein
MHKRAMKCNETLGKWCKNKHGASKIIDTLETYQENAILIPSAWHLPHGWHVSAAGYEDVRPDVKPDVKEDGAGSSTGGRCGGGRGRNGGR